MLAMTVNDLEEAEIALQVRLLPDWSAVPIPKLEC